MHDRLECNAMSIHLRGTLAKNGVQQEKDPEGVSEEERG